MYSMRSSPKEGQYVGWMPGTLAAWLLTRCGVLLLWFRTAHRSAPATAVNANSSCRVGQPAQTRSGI